MKRKNHTKKTKFSGHNKTKLPVLLVCFNAYHSVAEIAKATFTESLGINIAHHTDNIRKSLWKYRNAFTHPYLESRRLKKQSFTGQAIKASGSVVSFISGKSMDYH